MKTPVDIGILIGKTITKVIHQKHQIVFCVGDEHYALGNDNKKNIIYKDSIIGNIKDLVGLPLVIVNVVPKKEDIIFSLNAEQYNTCADPRFPWGHYLLSVHESKKNKVVIRWFTDENNWSDFYSHQVQFNRIK